MTKRAPQRMCPVVRGRRCLVGCLAAAALLTSPSMLRAQAPGRGPERTQGIPPGHMPPKGHCRVWYDGLPPGSQPLPTDCASAREISKRTGGRVIYGSERHGDVPGRDWRSDTSHGAGEPTISLPLMTWAVDYGRGQIVPGVREWVGDDILRAHYGDADRDGVPEHVTWYDTRRRILQRWIDDDRDGRADRVAFYGSDGRLFRVIR